MSLPAEAEEPATSVTGQGELGAGVDLWLLGATLALAAFGLVMVLSASGHLGVSVHGTPWGFGLRQAVGLAMGAFGGLVVLAVPWAWVRRSARPAWLVTLLLVFAVQSPLGHAAKGAPRWLDLGPINLQPSELAKIGLALVLADHLHRNEGHLKDPAVLFVPLAVFVVPMLIGVHLQSDLGTIALLLGITFVAFFVAGLDWGWVFAAIALVAVGVTGLILIEPYRMARIASFLDPLGDPLGEGYQVVQGWVALAVGGLTGAGLGEGVAQQGFLPEAHTDMIGAVVAEELGVPGWLAIFLLHGVVLWRGTRIAAEARNLFDMILAASLASVIAAQVIVNTGVIGGIVPPKGLVLPFMSYGASAAIAHTLMIALLLRVGVETHRGTHRGG